jgi:5-methylcytosine-specific restriction endonuclease McrA
MEYSEKFKARAESLYSSIRARAREKRDKNQRITRPGYLIPFTPEQFRGWLLAQFGGAEGGVSRCPYCNRPIDVYNCVIDHADPLKRGGSPDRDNLVACCATDNDIKGQMTRAE